MTDTLGTRAAGMVTAFMEPSDHPIRRPGDDAVPIIPAPTSPPVAGDAPVLPAPPERGSLDDDDLVPLVGRHTTDTATVDLIGILQAQMQLRAAEAARFAAWEEQMRLIGTSEALQELEKTRLHFTGVIPVQTSPSVVSAAAVPVDTAIVPVRLERPAPAVVTVENLPEPGRNAHDERARQADALLLEQDDTGPTPVRGSSVDGPSRTTRILVTALTGLAAALVVAALVVTALVSLTGIAALLGALAVLAASWLGVVAGRLALRPRGSVRPSTRSRAALVLAVVVGTAVGEGLVRTSDRAFAWQGYLQRLVQVHGLFPELSLVAGLVAALVLAFAVVVLLDRGRSAAALAAA
jgi:hypothetical protein